MLRVVFKQLSDNWHVLPNVECELFFSSLLFSFLSSLISLWFLKADQNAPLDRLIDAISDTTPTWVFATAKIVTQRAAATTLRALTLCPSRGEMFTRRCLRTKRRVCVRFSYFGSDSSSRASLVHTLLSERCSEPFSFREFFSRPLLPPPFPFWRHGIVRRPSFVAHHLATFLVL